MSKKAHIIFGIIAASAFFALFPAKNTHAEITCLTPHITPTATVSIDGDCSSTPASLKKYLLDNGYSEFVRWNLPR